MMSDSTLLLIGYGYLGKCFVQHHAESFADIFVSSRSQEKLAALNHGTQPGTQPGTQHGVCLDINDNQTWDNLNVLQAKQLVLCCCVTPSQVNADQFFLFLQYLQQFSITKAVLSSSTVVYGAQTGDIDSDSAISIDSERARRQWQLEQHWMKQMNKASIIRLAGLYGPARIIGKRSLLTEQVLPGHADDCLNLIHVQDAAGLLKAMLDSDRTGLELACDDHPTTRGEYYATVAELLQLPPPCFSHTDTGGHRRRRRCSNALTKARLRWQPKYSSYIQFLEEEARANT